MLGFGVMAGLPFAEVVAWFGVCGVFLLLAVFGSASLLVPLVWGIVGRCLLVVVVDSVVWLLGRPARPSGVAGKVSSLWKVETLNGYVSYLFCNRKYSLLKCILVV